MLPRLQHVKSFSDVLSAAPPDKPQAIVAGWINEANLPVAAVAIRAEVYPTTGQLAVCLGSCLAACLQKIDQLCTENPSLREQIMTMVRAMVDGLDVVGEFPSDLATCLQARPTQAAVAGG